MAERTVESVAAELQKLTGNSLYGTRLAAAAGYALRCERAALERAAGEMEFYARSSDDLGDRVGASAHRGDAALLRRLAAEGIDRRASGEPTDGKRLDWLGGEIEREAIAIFNNQPIPRSLFRCNEPITRAAIDAAMRGEGGE